jgi:integrase
MARLTPAEVLTLAVKAGQKCTVHWDDALPGFGLSVTDKAHRSYVVQYRNKKGVSCRMTVAATTVLTLTDARKLAKTHLQTVAMGGDPLAARRKEREVDDDTLQAVLDRYFAMRATTKLRTADHRRAVLNRLVLPKLGKTPIVEITRPQIVRLLDNIESENGAVMADMVLAYLRRLLTWHASRSETYNSPIVRGMARTKPKDLARKRVLSDTELRAVWMAAEASQSVFGYLVRFLLLTATRRNEAAWAAQREFVEGVWTIPEERYKTGRELLIPLSPAAQTLLAEIPKVGRLWLFTTRGKRPFGGPAKCKRKLDAAALAILRKQDAEATLPQWGLHDLRRTARSLMSRAKVNADVAERCLGHTIGGVRATYDRHNFFDEKKDAFERLAAEVDRIVNLPPTKSNARPLLAA